MLTAHKWVNLGVFAVTAHLIFWLIATGLGGGGGGQGGVGVKVAAVAHEFTRLVSLRRPCENCPVKDDFSAGAPHKKKQPL